MTHSVFLTSIFLFGIFASVFSQTQLVLDGSFETYCNQVNNPVWTIMNIVSKPLEITNTSSPSSYDGTCDVVLTSQSVASISQSLIIPSGGTATLRFWTVVPSNSFISALIDGNEVVSLIYPNSSWTLSEVDISSYCDGSSHTLKFQGSVYSNVLLLDDVSITWEASTSGVLSSAGATSSPLTSGVHQTTSAITSSSFTSNVRSSTQSMTSSYLSAGDETPVATTSYSTSSHGSVTTGIASSAIDGVCSLLATNGNSGYYCSSNGSAFYICTIESNFMMKCSSGTSCQCDLGVECGNGATESPCTLIEPSLIKNSQSSSPTSISEGGKAVIGVAVAVGVVLIALGTIVGVLIIRNQKRRSVSVNL